MGDPLLNENHLGIILAISNWNVWRSIFANALFCKQVAKESKNK